MYNNNCRIGKGKMNPAYSLLFFARETAKSLITICNYILDQQGRYGAFKKRWVFGALNELVRLNP